MFRLLYNLIITIFRFIARFNEAIKFFMVNLINLVKNYMNFIIIIVIKLTLIIFIIISTITIIIIINIKIIIFLINFNYLNVKANQKYFF